LSLIHLTTEVKGDLNSRSEELFAYSSLLHNADSCRNFICILDDCVLFIYSYMLKQILSCKQNVFSVNNDLYVLQLQYSNTPR